MGIRKIADLPAHETCRDSEHNPPTHIYLSNGVYEHTCPSCKHTMQFTVRHPSYSGGGTGTPYFGGATTL